jgi:hypothetical protein
MIDIRVLSIVDSNVLLTMFACLCSNRCRSSNETVLIVERLEIHGESMYRQSRENNEFERAKYLAFIIDIRKPSDMITHMFQ